jgi:hypothetical protein
MTRRSSRIDTRIGSVALVDSEARQGGWYIELEIRLLWPVG